MAKAAFDRNSILKEMEENKKNVRELVMESYRDIIPNDISGYFRSITRPIDGLKVQRGMRDEWD
ncbi:MAG: hypothetical protein IJ733_08115 [Lachnospiraceae bacterium]|nr:hypothetical protein [Lachnospiraceae bacterium]